MSVGAPLEVAQALNPYLVTCNAGATTPIVVVALPRALDIGQKISFDVSMQYAFVGAGVTEIDVSVNWCNSDGTFPANRSGTWEYANYNVAYWIDDDFAPGEQKVFAASWGYDPRMGDWQNEGPNGLQYLGVHISPIGADQVKCDASYIRLMQGAVRSAYWPHP